MSCEVGEGRGLSDAVRFWPFSLRKRISVGPGRSWFDLGFGLDSDLELGLSFL